MRFLLAAAVALLSREMPREDQRVEVERRATAVVTACNGVASMFAPEDVGVFPALCIRFAFDESRYVEEAEGDWTCARGRVRTTPTPVGAPWRGRASWRCSPGWNLVPQAFGAWQSQIGAIRGGLAMCDGVRGLPTGATVAMTNAEAIGLAKTYGGGACLFAASIARAIERVDDRIARRRFPRLRGIARLAAISSSHIIGGTRLGGDKGWARAGWAWRNGR